MPYSGTEVVSALKDIQREKKRCLPGKEQHIIFCTRRSSLYWKAPV